MVQGFLGLQPGDLFVHLSKQAQLKQVSFLISRHVQRLSLQEDRGEHLQQGSFILIVRQCTTSNCFMMGYLSVI